MDDIFQGRDPLTPERLFSPAVPAPEPDLGDYLSQHVSLGFDHTVTGRIMEDTAIRQAEREEGTFSEDFRQQQFVMGLTGHSRPIGEHPHAMPEQDWKASPWYREGMDYRPDMTPTRARIMAENFDRRRYRENLIARGDEAYSAPLRALGMGAVLVGSLPDPINFIPFGGGVKAARAAGSTGKAVLAGARAGAVEGAAATAVSDALVLPDLASRGEDVGYRDALLDTAFGAVLGGALGGLGGGASAWMRSRREGADLLRAGLSPEDRRTAVLAVEKALTDLEDGQPVDVSPILRETRMLEHASDRFRAEPPGVPPEEVYAWTPREGHAPLKETPPDPVSGRGITISHPAGEQGAGHVTDLPLPGTEAVPPLPDRFAVERADAFDPAPPSRGKADELSGPPDGADVFAPLPEEVIVRELEATQALGEIDIRELGAARDAVRQAERMEAAGLELMECIWGMN